MHLEVRALNVSPTDALLSYTDDRLRSSLRRLSHAVDSAVLRIKCIRGPRGHASQQCHVLLRLKSGGELVIEDADRDVYRAIDRVAIRTRRTIVRRLTRLRRRRRRA